MKKLVLKNSLLVAILTIMAFFIFMPAQAHAFTVDKGVLVDASLNGYDYSFSTDTDDYTYSGPVTSTKIYVRAMTDMGTDVAVFDGTPTGLSFSINLEDVCTELFEESNVVTVIIGYKINEYEFMDAIVFDKIAVSETVEEAAVEDTTFEYDVDTVMTPNISDVDLEQAIYQKDADGNTTSRISYYLEYLRNKTDIISANEDAKKEFQWVGEHKLVLKKGEKTASGYVVLAATISKIAELAGVKAGEELGNVTDQLPTDMNKKEGDDLKDTLWPQVQKLATLIPLGINIKEVKVSGSQYTLSSQQYGITFAPIADYLTAREVKGVGAEDRISIAEIVDKAINKGDVMGSVLMPYVEARLLNEEGAVDFAQCLAILNFKGYKNPQELVDAFNAKFYGMVALAINTINNSKEVSDALVVYAIAHPGRTVVGNDNATKLAYIYDKYGNEPRTIGKPLEDLLKKNASALGAVLDSVVAESATKLEIVEVAAFKHGINTGDANNYVLWIAMLMMSLVGAAGLAIKKN